MTAGVAAPQQDDMARPGDLRFDPINPRMPLMRFTDDVETIKYMMETHDVDELVRSILATGWLDYEPLIVEDATNHVLEGNRRLAALKLIGSADLRAGTGYQLPAIPDPKPLPDRIRIRRVPDRKTARAFIGFKHVNGPVKWDAYAKARFAAEWLDDAGQLADVSRALGDTHNTIRRLVDGWRVLQQAISWGFNIDERGARKFSFSHLYTAIARPSARAYLGLTTDLSDVLPSNPVPPDHRVQLAEFMSWLYGQGQDKPPVLRSQNPDLNRIVEVLTSAAATSELVRSRNLDAAYEMVVPKSDRFADAVFDAIRSAEKAAGLHAYFTGDQVQFEAVQNLFLTIRGLRDNMRKKLEGDED